MTNKQKAIKLRSKKAYENVITGLKNILGSKMNQHLENVTTSDITKYRDYELDGGLVPRTVNQKLKIASQIFSDAKNQAIIKLNPVELTERASSKIGTGQEPFSVAQVRELILNSDEDWKGIILIAYSTGFRLKDCSELKWSNLDMENNWIILETEKTDYPTKIPIEPNLKKWLSSRKQNRDCGWVLPKLGKKSGSGKSGLSSTFGKIMKKAGIVGKVTMLGQKRGRTRSSLGFHSLRHTYIAELTKNGIPEELRMKLSAHTTRQSHQIYTHHEQEKLESAINSLPSVV
jgi:integrase